MLRPFTTKLAATSRVPLRQAIAFQRQVHSSATRLQSNDETPVSPPASEEAKKTLPQKASHIVRSILHGSEQVRQETKYTLSKVLARGKYVHELATHSVKPGCMEEYKAVVGELYPLI
ncbi:hypothetical protein EV176_006497, partial [Coemansia sp. RSA 451]